MKNIILNNFGLKILAFFLAVMTWFYVVTELHKGAIEEREALQSILPYRAISKQVPIMLDLTGEPQEGYSVDHDKIVVNPSMCIMIGPKSLMKRLTSVKTEPIDISGYAKTVTKDVTIAPPAKGITIKEKFVKVTIPIVKIKD